MTLRACLLALTAFLASLSNLGAAAPCAAGPIVSLRVNTSASSTPVLQDVNYCLDSTGAALGSSYVLLDSPVLPSGTSAYHYSLGSIDFRGVNAFFHTDSMYRWLARIYPAIKLPTPVDISVSASSTLTNPGPFMTFGEEVAGRHAAVDPGIVAHEAGHALLFVNHIYAGQGAPSQYVGLLTQRHSESIGIHEGMATFLAAAYLGTTSIGAYGSIYAQRTDRPTTTHRMSQYASLSCGAQQQYCVGELWSSFLRDYHVAAGDSALSVILRSLKYWPNAILTFESAADAIRAAAAEVGGGQPAALASALAAREIGNSVPVARILGPSVLPHQHTGWYLDTVDGGLPPYTFNWTKRLRVDEETTLTYSNLSGSPTPDSLICGAATTGGAVLTVIGTVTDQRGAAWTDSLQVDVYDGWAPPTSGIQIASQDGSFSAQPNQLKVFTAPYNSIGGYYNNAPAEWEYRIPAGAWAPVGVGKSLEFRFPSSYELRAHRNGFTSPVQAVTVSGGPIPTISATPPEYTCTTNIGLLATASGGVPGYVFGWAADDDGGVNVSMSSTSGSTSGFTAFENWEYVDVTLFVTDSWGTGATTVRRIHRVGACSGGEGGGGDPGDLGFGAGRQILFSLPREGLVQLSLYDVAGREVAPLMRHRLPAGHHAVVIPKELELGRALFVALRVDGQLLLGKRLLVLK